MNVRQWLSCADPGKMLNYLGGHPGHRKLRLLACHVCRRLFGAAMTDPRTHRAVSVAERYAEGTATKQELTAARQEAAEAHETSWRAKRAAWWATHGRPGAALRGVLYQPVPPPWHNLGVGGPRQRPTPLAPAALAPACALIREVVGNPFHPLRLDPTWLTWNDRTVARLAEAIHQEQDFARLPVLADALEEAGCADADLLRHCRTRAGHVRGCWAVDLLRG
jgi:hypothetical protein